MDAIPDSDFLTDQEKEDARKETNVEFIKAYNARSFAYPRSVAVKSAKDIQAFAEDKLVAKSFTEMRCELPGAPRSTFLMVFSPDGTKVASTHGNHNIYVSDVRTGKNIMTLMGHPRTPWCIAFHPTSNQIIASGCLGGQVRIWDLSGGSEMWSSDNSTVIASLTFHPEDRLLVIATYNQLHFWDWSKPEPFATISTATTKEKVRYVAFDPLGHKLVTGISNNTSPQSRWERAHRYVPSPSNLPTNRPPDYPTTPLSSSAPSPAHPQQQPPLINNQAPLNHQPFSNMPPYTGRAQRARLSLTRMLAQSRAFPSRTGPDAHVYQNMFFPTPSRTSSTPSVSHQPQIDSSSTSSSGDLDYEQEPGTMSSLDMFADIEASRQQELLSSTSPNNHTTEEAANTSPPSTEDTYIVETRRASTPTPSSSTTPPSTSVVADVIVENRIETPPIPQEAATSSNIEVPQEVSVSVPPPVIPPLLRPRREPLSSVPDRERRISACYRNLVREYEQLVHRYLQIYRPPVMIDRGTDPMELVHTSTCRLHSNIQADLTSTPSTSRSISSMINHNPRTISNPANIQPVSSNSLNNPTDMRAVCEFTTTDPSVLSPLRNYEVEAARRNSAVYQEISLTRRQLTDNSTRRDLNAPSEVRSSRAIPTQTGDSQNEATSTDNNNISLMLKNVEEALTTFRNNVDEPAKNPVVKTYIRSNQQSTNTSEAQTSASITSNPTGEEQAITAAGPNEHEDDDHQQQNINLESTNLNVDSTTTTTSNNQNDVNDLITNLTIISSMAVQLKSVAERLTLHKDNEQKIQAPTENPTESSETVASDRAKSPQPSTSKDDNSNEPNVAEDIKLAKKMVDKIVEIMNTFSTESTTSRKRTKSNRKPILVDSSSSSSDSNINNSDAEEGSSAAKRAKIDAPSTDAADNTQGNEEAAVVRDDNASDTTSASMYNNVTADDIASTSDFAERRPWNYNRELEQLVTDLLHDNNNNNNAQGVRNNFVEAESTHTLCSVCGDTLGTCSATDCRNSEMSARSSEITRRRRFFCHRLSAFHPTRVHNRLHNNRFRYSLPNSVRTLQQDPAAAADEVVNFSLRSAEPETASSINTPEDPNLRPRPQSHIHLIHRFGQVWRPIDLRPFMRTAITEPSVQQVFVDPPVPSYHPFDPPPELDTINPEHIGIGNMYSNIVQELETSLSDIRNIRSQRRLGETSNVLSNFSERLESIMTQSHAILRNLSTSIEVVPGQNQNGSDHNSGRSLANNNQRGNNNSWSPISNHSTTTTRDGDLSSSPSSISGINRNPAVDPHSVNAEHNYPRPTHNMSPLMASLHLTVSHIWRQARLLRSQMDSIERIDRAMLELAQLRVMRQMFADISRYFSVGGIGGSNTAGESQADSTPRQSRASNTPDRTSGSSSNKDKHTSTKSTGTATTSTPSEHTTVNSMRRMMAGTRISDSTHPSTSDSQTSTLTSLNLPSASSSGVSSQQSGRLGSATAGRARKMYPCVLVMHPRNNRRYPNGGVTTMTMRRGLSRARYLGSRRSVFRQVSNQIIDVSAPGRARNYMNLLNPDTFPALSHRLEHYLIEHGRYIGRRRHQQQQSSASAPSTSATNSNSASPSSERLLTIRLNNCRLRMHRLFGGRTQYATNANTGPHSLVSRDGAGRFHARHTLCVMLDTLSRFMEVYGTGLVGISGSFRTYLREVIDLSRLLSEVLLLQIVDTIPPPTGMMLDPERQNLSHRIDEMCNRMILTRLCSQSQPLSRSLRLMRLNVRFFSHSLHQNRLLERRFNMPDYHNAAPPPSSVFGDPSPTDSPPNPPPQCPYFPTLASGVRRRPQDNRDPLPHHLHHLRLRHFDVQYPSIDESSTQQVPDLNPSDEEDENPPPPLRRSSARRPRWQHFETRHMREQRRLEEQRLAAELPRLPSPPPNMSDLLYHRLGQDRASIDADIANLRARYQTLTTIQDAASPEHLGPDSDQSLSSPPRLRAPPRLHSPPIIISPSPPPPGGISAATTENQRFLDSLGPPTPSAGQLTRPTPTPVPLTSVFVSPLRWIHHQRRTYMRSNAYEAGRNQNIDEMINNAVEHHRERARERRSGARGDARPDGAEANVRTSNIDVFAYYRESGPMWSVPEVQVNNVPIGHNSAFLNPVPYQAPHMRGINRNLQDDVVILPPSGPRHMAPIFSRPRFLHPLYSWSGLNPYPFDGSPGAEMQDESTARGGDQQVYESDIIAAVTPNHRIQVWEFNRVGEGNGVIPNITNALKNVVVGECKIHNDASVDIASDGSVLVTLLPSNSYLNITNRLGIYSLEWETLGQCLYITTFDQNAVSVSLSPLSRHLVVGLASRRVSIMPSEQWTLARIFLLDGRRMAFGRLSLMKEIEQSRDTNFVMSVNCIRWLPTSGQGLVFATNTGQLRILN